jgi:hypothetical protein
VSPSINPLESLFDKEGLREFGASGLKEGLETASTGRPSLMLSRWEPDDWQLDNMLGEK